MEKLKKIAKFATGLVIIIGLFGINIGINAIPSVYASQASDRADKFMKLNKNKELEEALKKSNRMTKPPPSLLGPKTDTCPANQNPELILENLKLDAVAQSEDFNALEYKFSLNVKNFHTTQPYGPFNAPKGISLSVFDGTKLQADGMAENVTYGQLLSDYELTTVALLSEGGKGVKISCNQSVNFKNIIVSIPKDVHAQDLIFMVDSLNKIPEKNDASNQNNNTNAALKDNNIVNYQIAQPFKSFQLAVSNYDKNTKILDFKSSFKFENSVSENDLKKLGYSFITEIWKIAENNKIELLENIGANEEFELQFYGAFVKEKPEAVTSIDFLTMSGDPAQWTTDANLKMNAGENHFAVLNMTAPDGNRYPLYAIRVVGPEPEIGNQESEYQNCDYKAGKCHLLIFKRTSESVIEVNANSVNEASPALASSFQACNRTSKIATIQSLKFKLMTGANQKPNGADIVNTFFVNDKSIWDSIKTKNYGNDNNEAIAEIVLQEPLIVNPGDCHDIKINTTSVDENFKYEFITLMNVKSDVTPYLVNQGNNYLDSFLNSFEGMELKGTNTVFQAENGALLKFYDYMDGNKIAYNTQNFVKIMDLEFSTNPNEKFQFNKLNFKIQSTYSGNLKAQYNSNVWSGISSIDGQFTDNVIEIPANGEFSIDNLNASLGFWQNYSFSLYILPPMESPGEITISLTGVEPNNNNLVIVKNSQYVPYNDQWIESKKLPLSNTVYFVETGEAAVNFSVYPNSYWGNQRWFSKADMGKDKLWGIDISVNYNPENNFKDSPYIAQVPAPPSPEPPPNAPPPTPEELKTITLSDLDLLFEGNFDGLDLNITVNTGKQNTQKAVTVFPGQTVTLDLPDMNMSQQAMYIQIDLVNYPELDLFNLYDIQVIPQPISATYFNNEKIPVIVENAKINSEGDVKYMLEEFVLPYVNADIYSLGKELLYLSGDFNSPIVQNKKIEFLKPDESINMNGSCWNAIGDISLKKIVFQHDAHDEQPFDKVILNHNNENIYLPLAGWTLNEANFSPTPAVNLAHMNGPCLQLNIQGPKEPLNGTFFDLVQINGVIMDSDIPISVIANKNSKEELSINNPIKGTVYNFK